MTRYLAIPLALAVLLILSSMGGLAQSDEETQEQPDTAVTLDQPDEGDADVTQAETDVGLVLPAATPQVFRTTSGKVLTTAEATVLAHAVSALGTRAALRGQPLRTPTPDGQ